MLVDVLRQINERIRIVRMQDFLVPDRVGRTIREHVALIDAVLAGDIVEAERQLVTHIDNSVAVVEERVTKVLYGVNHPQSGQLYLDEEPVTIALAVRRPRPGIGMVFQDLRLVPAFTVARTSHRDRLGPRQAQGARRPRRRGERFGLAVDPRPRAPPVDGERQRVEILQVLMADAHLVILDEPTSVLAPQEVDRCSPGSRSSGPKGSSVVIITHKLRETRAIADRATILRGGQVVIVAGEAPGS